MMNEMIELRRHVKMFSNMIDDYNNHLKNLKQIQTKMWNFSMKMFNDYIHSEMSFEDGFAQLTRKNRILLSIYIAKDENKRIYIFKKNDNKIHMSYR